MKIKKIIQTLPFLIFTIFFYLYGLYYVLMTSFGFNSLKGESKFTLDFYKEILKDKDFYNTLFYTIKINFIAAFLALGFSIFILYLIYLGIKRKFKFIKKFEKIVEAPVFIPYLVGAYSVLLLLMRRGVINTILFKFGIIKKIENFPILTNDLNGIGIIFTYIWKTTPFMVMMTLPIIFRIDNKWDHLKKLYNLGDFLFFKKIVFPLILPTLATSFFIVLTYLFSAFETPYILGVTYPKVLSVDIYDLYTRSFLDKRGVIMAMNILLSLLALGFSGGSYLFLKYILKFKKREW